MASPSVPDTTTQDLDGQLEELSRDSNFTAAQALVWLNQQRLPNLPIHQTAVLWFIPAEVERARFERAFQRVVDDCDALRTIVETQASAPIQRVLGNVPAAVEFVDLTKEADPVAAARLWAEQRSQTLFDLDQKLFDAALLQLAEGQSAFFLNQHRLIADGWSALLIFRRISEAYQASLEGTADALPPTPLFSEFVEAERKFAGTTRFPKARLYWQQKISRTPTPLSFATGDSTAGRTERVRLSCGIGLARSQRLREICAGPAFAGAFQNLSLFSLFTGLFLTCLHHRSGQQRFAVAIPASARTSRKLEDTAGLCTHMVVEHFEVSGDDHLLTLSNKVRGEMVEVLRQQAYAVSTLPPRRLFDTLINFCHGKAGTFLGQSVRAEFIDSGHQDDSQEKLALQVRDYEATGEFTLDFDFRLDAFTDNAREEVVRHFFGIMDAFLADNEQPVRLLSPAAPPKIGEFTIDRNEIAAGRAICSAQETAHPAAQVSTEPFVAPRTPTEQTVARLWNEVLGLEKSGVNDDFFALGGHSMPAVRMFAAIEEAFGVNLPLSTLLEFPTIAKLSAHLDQTDRSAEWPSVVKVQDGRDGLMPIFCTHGLGGDILGFRTLAVHLDKRRPIYGLRARGLDGKSPPKDRIEDMAAAYIEEILETQKEGPYSILGFSFGGLIAYEIGRQMLAKGRKMNMVGLLDTRKLLSPKTFLLNVALVPFKQKIEFIQAAMGARAHGGALARSRLSALSANSGAPSLRPDRIRAVRKGSIKASHTYKVPPYGGRLSYFRTKKLLAPAVFERLHHPWEELCRGGVDFYELPCDHWSILREPYVQALAGMIESCMQRADPPGSHPSAKLAE